MAEYWKSLPRKFCDVCKCWFADNKASIDFHERGKRHKENAQKRIQDIQKRGIKEFKQQQKLENEMEKIEKAALAAYEKDLKNMQGGDTSQSSIQPSKKFTYTVPEPNIKHTMKDVQKKQDISIKSSKQPEIETTPEKVWYEAMSEEGYKYYWNAVTSESSWEPPEEGFISIEEQNQISSETVSEEEQCKSLEDTETTVKETETDSDDVSCSMGPQPKVDPYGQWIPIEKEEPVEYDLQLPVSSENTIEVVIPIHKDEPSLKFKEKIIGQLSESDSGEVTFKKRRNAGSFKKNARQRFTDDD